MQDKDNKKNDDENKKIEEDNNKEKNKLHKREELEDRLREEFEKLELLKSELDQNSKLIFKVPKQSFLNFLSMLLIGVVIDYILFLSITGYKPWLEVEPSSKYLLYFTIFTISFSIIDTTLRTLMLRLFPKLVILSGGTINILITMLAFIGCSLIPNITIVSHWDVIIIIMFLLVARSIINYYINKKIIVTIWKKRKK